MDVNFNLVRIIGRAFEKLYEGSRNLFLTCWFAAKGQEKHINPKTWHLLHYHFPVLVQPVREKGHIIKLYCFRKNLRKVQISDEFSRVVQAFCIIWLTNCNRSFNQLEIPNKSLQKIPAWESFQIGPKTEFPFSNSMTWKEAVSHKLVFQRFYYWNKSSHLFS